MTPQPSEVAEDGSQQTRGPSGWPNMVRRLVTLGVIAAMISPAIRNHDSLPLSTYPMYAGTRSDSSSYATAVGIESTGERSTLSTTVIAATQDWLIAQSFLNDAVRNGNSEAVCNEISRRAPRDLDRIEVATERHNTVARMLGDESLLERTVHATCEVSS